METRIALIAVVVGGVGGNPSVARLNEIVGEYSHYIIGRMGIPYREKDVSLISLAIDAPQSEISALSGKLGMLEGVTAKTVYAGVDA